MILETKTQAGSALTVRMEGAGIEFHFAVSRPISTALFDALVQALIAARPAMTVPDPTELARKAMQEAREAMLR